MASILALITDHALTLGGLAWDPHYRGALTVITAVAILMGSIYLILYTNVGARLGFLVALGGLFGWMTILGLTWWLAPPAIGPRGTLPEWQPVEIVYGDPSTAGNEAASDLPNACFSTTSAGCEQLSETDSFVDDVIAANPDLVEELNEGATLSDAAVLDPDVVADLELEGWHVVSNADAGEAQAVAGGLLVEDGVFEDPTDFKVLDTFEIGGKPERDDDDMVSRVAYKFSSAARLRHPIKYSVVQVQPVITQEAVPGEPPPLPEVDPNAQVISIVMVRELGNRRVPPAMVTIASAILLGVTAYALHRRDKLSDEHRAETPAGAD
jgi:hypothetical protein